MGNPILYIVIPCYNEEAVLPLTSGMFLKKIKDLAAAGKISDKSRILFVNDGSKDKTWDIIRSLAEADEHYRGVCLSRNRGHQNALLAGLMTAKDLADVTISIDCDGQDDINAMDAMIDEYLAGMDVVYGGGLKADNAAMLASIADIDGGLIALTRFSGEIGFYPDEYLEIIRLYLGH